MSRLSLFLAIFSFLMATKFYDVSGDQALIDEVCKKAPQPGFCNLCIREDPNRNSEDAIRLARASTECSITRSFRVSVDLDTIANSNSDNRVRDVCHRCQIFLRNAIMSLQAAQRHLDGKRFRDAANVAGEAGDNHRKCAELLVGDFPATPTFTIDFDILKKYYVNAAAILSQLV